MKSRHELTRQEIVVLTLIAQGWRNAHIASELFISIKTVETHVSRIFDKIDVATRTQAALYAFQHGFVTLPKISGTPDETHANESYAET